MNQTPDPRPRIAPAMHLAGREQQITAPHMGATQPLPPVRSLGSVLWQYSGRIAPALVTTAALALALIWHEQLPDGSTQPLWIMGGAAAIASILGTASAARQHGSSGITGTAYAAAGTAAMIGIAAHTPHWALSILMWLLATAATYALCAPHWRGERQERLSREHEIAVQQARNYQELAVTALETSSKVQVAQLQVEGERLVVEGIVAASAARTGRTLAPGDELSVPALLAAAGHHAPVELSAVDRREPRWER